MSAPEPVALASLHLCFEGAVPAVVATASADGTPNVTYLSRVRMVDARNKAMMVVKGGLPFTAVNVPGKAAEIAH